VSMWRARGRVPLDPAPAIERETGVRAERLHPGAKWTRIPDPSWPVPEGRPVHDPAGQSSSGATCENEHAGAADQRTRPNQSVMAPSLIGHGGDLNERKPSVGASDRPTTPKER
jgi:hypothetical protein